MLLVEFGSKGISAFLIRGNKLERRLFSANIDEIIDFIGDDKHLDLRIICVNPADRCFYKKIPRIHASVALDFELAKYEGFLHKRYQAFDRIKGEYLFMCTFLDEAHKRLMSVIEPMAQCCFIAQLEIPVLLNILSKGLVNKKNCIDVLIIETEVSGFIAFVYAGGVLKSCDPINTMEESKPNVLTGFIVQYLENEVTLKNDCVNLFLIARNSVVTAFMSTNMNKFDYVMALNPSEVAIIIGCIPDLVSSDDSADLVLALIFGFGEYDFQHVIRLGKSNKLMGFLCNYGYRIIGSIGLAFMLSYSFDIYLNYRDYLTLIEDHSVLEARYYSLVIESSFKKNDELLWLRGVIKAGSAFKVSYKDAFLANLRSDSYERFSWELVYFPQFLFQTDKEIEVKVCFTKFDGDRRVYDCRLEIFK